ncbi:unnamed protein product [Ilex paraguariensis]|uniref:Uncharacterized protein n=1 Tax=Ilex paraguariensis TaxID=185542 RepID=A0ABC8UUN7_9AQUA
MGNFKALFEFPRTIGSEDVEVQERCQTRATKAEYNLACAVPEDGANHTTTKSPTAFPPLQDLATLNSIPSICGGQNLDNDIIEALFDDNDRTISILSGSGEILSLVDGENVNPCEREVNSKTNPSCAIQARQEAINNSVMNTLPEPYGFGEARSPRLMSMFSSILGIFH